MVKRAVQGFVGPCGAADYIFEFRDDIGPNFLGFKPQIQVSSEVRVVGGQQHGHAIQAAGKLSLAFACQLRHRHESDCAIAKTVKRPHLEVGVDGASDRITSSSSVASRAMS